MWILLNERAVAGIGFKDGQLESTGSCCQRCWPEVQQLSFEYKSSCGSRIIPTPECVPSLGPECWTQTLRPRPYFCIVIHLARTLDHSLLALRQKREWLNFHPNEMGRAVNPGIRNLLGWESHQSQIFKMPCNASPRRISMCFLK